MTSMQTWRSATAGLTERWMIANSTPPYVDNFATRLASFDREALGAVKAQVNRVGLPTGSDIESSYRMFFATVASAHAQARRGKDP